MVLVCILGEETISNVILLILALDWKNGRREKTERERRHHCKRAEGRTLVHTHRNIQLSPGGVASLKVYTNKNVPTDGLDVGAVEVEVELGRRVPCLCTAVREPLPRAWVSLKKRSWLGTLARAIKR